MASDVEWGLTDEGKAEVRPDLSDVAARIWTATRLREFRRAARALALPDSTTAAEVLVWAIDSLEAEAVEAEAVWKGRRDHRWQEPLRMARALRSLLGEEEG